MASGGVSASVRTMVFKDPVAKPGPVILKEEKSGHGKVYLLHVQLHRLHTISKQRDLLRQPEPPVRLPTPVGGGGSWGWSEPSPNGTEVLAQWDEQVSECMLPVAMIQKIASVSQSSGAYRLRSAPLGVSSSKVCAISSAVIGLWSSAVDIGSLSGVWR